jgi:hypothetical protein
MVSSGVLRRVAVVRTDVSEELSASFIRHACRVLFTAGVVASSPILVTLMKEALSSYETLVLTRATQRNIPEDAILHSHHRENLKSYIDTAVHWRHIHYRRLLQNIYRCRYLTRFSDYIQ